MLANDILLRPTLGTGIVLPATRDAATGRLKTESGEDNVLMCILNLLDTVVGERVMNEDVGTTANLSLFEEVESLLDVLPIQFKEVIERHEPRVYRVITRAERLPNDGQGVIVHLSWRYRSTGSSGNMVYPYNLSNGGNE